jgi:hypothetical protein
MSDKKKKLTEKISLEWHIDDVKCRRPLLTKEKCGAVLDAVEAQFDASVGVNWDTLEYWADELFLMDPETQAEVDEFLQENDCYGLDWDNIQTAWDNFLADKKEKGIDG